MGNLSFSNIQDFKKFLQNEVPFLRNLLEFSDDVIEVTLNGQLYQSVPHTKNRKISAILFDSNGYEFHCEVKTINDNLIELRSTTPLRGTLLII